MTDAGRLARLYVFAVTLLVFFLTWAVVAARPWAPKAVQDPRVAALAAREQRIHVQSLVVRKLQLAQRNKAQLASVTAAAAPAPRIVTLPPLTITRTS